MKAALVATCLMLGAPTAAAQARDAGDWSAHLAYEYGLTPDITYRTAGGVDLKLDVYAPRGVRAPNPVVLAFHGGGWAGGTRDRNVLSLMPFLEQGFTVVNATYRGSRVALAPAAVEDCRCALSWLSKNAAPQQFDLARIVVAGASAGGHLALITGMLTAADGFDSDCAATTPAPRVAAIVNGYGPIDVADLVQGPRARAFAADWLGAQPGRLELARRLSPLTYVRTGQPAVITVHGDADPVVPFDHASRLHAELEKAGVPNRLVPVAGKGHGNFDREDNVAAFKAIRAFLGGQGLLPPRP